MIAIVIGIGFGDEAKGHVVDGLAASMLLNGMSSTTRGLVVRFSGGAQAGHTVVDGNVRHIFSQFGSATLRGFSTYFSQFCTFNPPAFLVEHGVLSGLIGEMPMYYLHEDTPLVTPLDVTANRDYGEYLANGTVGAGHGTTLERGADRLVIRAVDMLYPSVLKAKLEMVRKYYSDRGVSGMANDSMFLEACKRVVSRVRITNLRPNVLANDIIFEGSQGLLLDEDIGFFPHVTRGHTDTRNVWPLLGTMSSDSVSVYAVTRAYLTRHGNGPLPGEELPLRLGSTAGETNVTHPYQGEFRRAPLDVRLLRYGMDRDNALRDLRWSHRLNLVVTCMDQLTEYTYANDGQMLDAGSAQGFLGVVASKLGVFPGRVTASYSAAPLRFDLPAPGGKVGSDGLRD